MSSLCHNKNIQYLHNMIIIFFLKITKKNKKLKYIRAKISCFNGKKKHSLNKKKNVINYNFHFLCFNRY